MKLIRFMCGLALCLTPFQLHGQPTPQSRADEMYTAARTALRVQPPQMQIAAMAVEEFIKTAPTDIRGGELLYRMGNAETEPAKKIAQYRRSIERYPESTFAQPSRGAIRQVDNVGKPFILEFNDLVTGKPVSIQKDFKGKVVVIEFWATWCSDCIADMPRIKALHEQYKDKGVQFIGVSVDQPESKGGLTALKDYVAKNDIKWPQYYQGNYMQSEFSYGWGINATPSAFVIDKQGNLHSYNAIKKLETIIPELLK